MDDAAALASGPMRVVIGDRTERFEAFCDEAEPRLRRALVAAYGPDLGSEATADALAWAWERFERIEAMGNPVGYLWRVGQTSVRRSTRRRDREATWTAGRDDRRGTEDLPAIEPALAGALARLSPRQRAAVLLVHGHDWTLEETARVLGCGVSTVRNHLRRGLASIRNELGVVDGDG